MECKKCGFIMDDHARYCSQCGYSEQSPNFTPVPDLKRPLSLALIIIAWELAKELLWMVINKGLVPFMNNSADSFESVQFIFKGTGIFMSLVTIGIGVAFAIMARHSKARLLFIFYAAIQFMSLLIYYVFS
jgi:hypothetical protein